MKNFLLILAFLWASPALADGYLTFKQPINRWNLGNTFDPYENSHIPDVSLFILEPLSKDQRWAFQSYNGFIYGTTLVLDEGVTYQVSRIVKLGIGVNYADGRIQNSLGNRDSYRSLEGKVWSEFKLW